MASGRRVFRHHQPLGERRRHDERRPGEVSAGARGRGHRLRHLRRAGRPLAGRDQSLCQLQRVHWPEALRTWTAYMRLSGHRAAVQQAVGPLGRNREPTVYSAKKRPTDGCVGVGVSTSPDGVHHGFLQGGSMEELPQGIPECDQDPALLANVIRWWCVRRTGYRLHEWVVHTHLVGPDYDLFIHVMGPSPISDGSSNRYREQRIGLSADRMGMGQSGILACPFGDLFESKIRSENSQRTDPHHGPVGLAVRIGAATEPTGDGHATVERAGIQPIDIRLAGLLSVVSSVVRQHPGQQQRHLGIICRLSGNGVPGSAIRQFPDTIRVFPSYLLRCLELHQAAQSVPGQLTEKAALGSGEHLGISGFAVDSCRPGHSQPP